MASLKKYGFTDEDSDWTFQEHFNALEGFMQSNYNLKGDVDFTIESYNDDGDFNKPQKFQELAYTYFCDNTKLIADNLCLGVIKLLPNFLHLYKGIAMPELKTIDDVKANVSFEAVGILGDEKEGYAYYIVMFNCTWDDEHGMSMLMHKDRAVNIGAGDIISEYSDMILQDNMSAEEWKVFEEDRRKKWEENLTQQLQQQKLAEVENYTKALEEKKSKWWKFW